MSQEYFMTKFLVAFALTFSATLVSADPLPSDKTFVRHLFETTAKCQEAQKKSGAWFNCSQTVSLYSDGTARIMVTDIINPGTYTVEKDKITVTPTRPSEFADPMIFTLTYNQRNLVDQYLQVWEWREKTEEK
jgi:hypothetical protein